MLTRVLSIELSTRIDIEQELVMFVLGLVQLVNSSVANRVYLVKRDIVTQARGVSDGAGITLVEVPRWVCEVRINNLEPDHVYPTVVLLGTMQL